VFWKHRAIVEISRCTWEIQRSRPRSGLLNAKANWPRSSRGQGEDQQILWSSSRGGRGILESNVTGVNHETVCARLIYEAWSNFSYHQLSLTVPWSLVLGSSRVDDTSGHTSHWYQSSQLAQRSCASYQDMQTSFKSCLILSIQFFLRLSRLHFVAFSSQCTTCFRSLPSSIHKTCPNNLSLLSLMISPNFCSSVFSLTSLFRTLSFNRSLVRRWNLWSAASNCFCCVTDRGHSSTQ